MLFATVALLCCAVVRAERNVDADLREAAGVGDLRAIKRLLSQGADPDKSDALLAAIAGTHLQAMNYLLTHGADPNAWARGRLRLPGGAEGSPVLQAARIDNPRFLRSLVRHGANLNAESVEAGRSGETPLLIAVRRGDVAAARQLLRAGADVNHRGTGGASALHEAVIAGAHAVELVQLLLDHGANPDLKDGAGRTARDMSYEFVVPEIREAIDRAKPLAPFQRPGDREHILEVLLYKAGCDQSAPDYEPRSREAYRRWRAPRADVIASIEAGADFQQRRAQSIDYFRKLPAAPPTASAPGEGAGQSEAGRAAEWRVFCDTRLPAEFADPRRR